MTRLAVVTDAVRPSLVDDDRPLLAAFAALGVQAVPVDWADERVDWRAFDAALIRSPWNYPSHGLAFEALVERMPIPVWNPAHVLRWNLRKTYLLELAAAGLPVPPTLYLPAGAPADLGPAFDRWERVVVKPEIGGTGIHTYTADAGSRRAVESAIAPRLREMGFLVQPFLPVVGGGESSLVYLDGVYSHAVKKIAAKGEFRVHLEHGGSVAPHQPSREQRAIADRFAAFVPDVPYTRVDLVGDGADALLMELELIEPELFFRFHPPAVDVFTRSIARRIA
jgi:glutathione synthase/RimK-type ligase-like ATP-grasp enzyme